MYGAVSASWEIGFSQYQIAVGSKNLKDAEIISDPKQIQEMSAMLRAFGGTGRMDDGTELYRLIVGDVYPLGIGYTMKPAADVKEVISNDNASCIEPEKEEKACIIINTEKKQAEDLKKICAKISQKIKNTVNTNNIMDLETLLSELKESLAEKKISEEAVAGMTSTFARPPNKKMKSTKLPLEAAETEKAEIAAAREELQASVESIKEELELLRNASQNLKRLKRLKRPSLVSMPAWRKLIPFTNLKKAIVLLLLKRSRVSKSLKKTLLSKLNLKFLGIQIKKLKLRLKKKSRRRLTQRLKSASTNQKLLKVQKMLMLKKL